MLSFLRTCCDSDTAKYRTSSQLGLSRYEFWTHHMSIHMISANTTLYLRHTISSWHRSANATTISARWGKLLPRPSFPNALLHQRGHQWTYSQTFSNGRVKSSLAWFWTRQCSSRIDQHRPTRQSKNSVCVVNMWWCFLAQSSTTRLRIWRRIWHWFETKDREGKVLQSHLLWIWGWENYIGRSAYKTDESSYDVACSIDSSPPKKNPLVASTLRGGSQVQSRRWQCRVEQCISPRITRRCWRSARIVSWITKDIRTRRTVYSRKSKEATSNGVFTPWSSYDVKVDNLDKMAKMILDYMSQIIRKDKVKTLQAYQGILKFLSLNVWRLSHIFSPFLFWFAHICFSWFSQIRLKSDV